jgi:hypothetical protein
MLRDYSWRSWASPVVSNKCQGQPIGAVLFVNPAVSKDAVRFLPGR